MNERKQRPWKLSVTALVILGFLFAICIGLGSSIRSNDSLRLYIFFLLVFLVVGVVGTWCYWLGQNWARRLVLAYSAYTVWFLVTWDHSNLTRWEIPKRNYGLLGNTLQVIFGAFLLYWLNTPNMQAFFEKPEPISPHNRFLNVLQQFIIWGAAILLLPVGILLGASYSFIRSGLSNVGLLAVYTAGPPILACLMVGIYYKLRRDRRTRRRLTFFVAAWTFLFGFLLITKPSPIRRWFQYYGGAITADKRLELYEGMKESSPPALRSKNRHLAEVSYSAAEEWHLWGITVSEGFGPASPLLAKALEDAGDFYRDRSQRAKALPLYRRSLAVWEKTFGPDNHFASQVRRKLNETMRSQEAIRATGQR